ncbi:hypothetical protein Rrhod_0333 [Rhodococcus rhodnii LMG 5362]|uniref:Uncharacterized protein n=1 Tax=Rhodococcus rhodnii LMG 5362 TaxID=1273125 RepID=R7WSR9_9NOCA|nr:hypothetical protein Rrhod_0333 [Rhodococcus rhodnii LMG 5362]
MGTDGEPTQRFHSPTITHGARRRRPMAGAVRPAAGAEANPPGRRRFRRDQRC